jgi:hypothetical protein
MSAVGSLGQPDPAGPVRALPARPWRLAAPGTGSAAGEYGPEVLRQGRLSRGIEERRGDALDGQLGELVR